MKLKRLKPSKMEAFLKQQIEDHSRVVVGGDPNTRIMSQSKRGAADRGDLTCTGTNGIKDYWGNPGDGVASDWRNVRWDDGASADYLCGHAHIIC